MSEAINSTKPNHIKRKRKKSFLKNARKYAKKGCYGRGSQLDVDTYQYFVRIMEAYREGFDSEDDKQVFVDNVFEQTVGQEINCCTNQVGCRVVELLLPFANEAVLERFMQKLGSEIRPLCSDRFATHVLETLVTKACDNSLKKDDFGVKCQEFTIKVSKFLLNNLEDFIWDTYGNHVIRTCLENLAQVPKEAKNFNNVKNSEVEVKTETLPEYVEIVKEYGERLIHWPQFNELVNNELTSGFLQILLKCLRKVDFKLLKKYLKKLLNDIFAPETENSNPNILPEVFLSKSSMMLLETCIQVAKSKMFTQIYAKCFTGKLVKLATIRNTNFSVQKLVSCCGEKVTFEAIFDELKDCFSEILEAGHSGILYGLGQGCKKFSTRQASFVQAIMKSLDCLEPEERETKVVFCLVKLTNYSKLEIAQNLQKDKLNLHGTLILQLILEYNKPIKLVNAILSMETNDLKDLFSNTMGSHIVDSFMQSAFIGEKSRERLLRRLKGTYQELASSKYGSRSFEAIWNPANLKNRQLIMEELSYKDGSWSNSEYGKIIAYKINLVLYKRNKEDWKNSLNTANKAKELFSDLLK